jgi:hypothetical protein
VGDDRLARRAEATDGLADFVGRGGRHAAFGQAHQQGLDRAVVRGLSQDVDHLHHRQLGPAEGREGIGRGLVGQAFAQVQLQHAGGRGGGARCAGHRHADQHDRQDDEEQDQPGEDAKDGQEKLFHVRRRSHRA